jgi:hypothetical protein
VNPLLDVKQITKNMQAHGTGVRATLARTHQPYVKSAYSNRLHRVKAVRVDWRTSHRRDYLAVFECGESTMHPQFSDTPDLICADHRCQKCFKAAA